MSKFKLADVEWK
jgi:hypothetical protein